MNARRLSTAVIACAALLGIATTNAEAKTYCVQAASCPAGGIPKGSLLAALKDPDGSDADPDQDEILFGDGTFELTPVQAMRPVTIRGAGIGRTVLAIKPGLTEGLALEDADSSATDLTVRVTTSHTYSGLLLQNGADASRVEVRTDDAGLTDVGGFVTSSGNSTLSHVQANLVPSGEAVRFFEGGDLRDSTIVGGTAVASYAEDSPARIVRSTLRGARGIRAFGGLATARDVLITPHPADPNAQPRGVEVQSTDDSQDASFTGSHLTLIGDGESGIGVLSFNDPKASAGAASANVTDSVIRDYKSSLYTGSYKASQKAKLGISYSSFDATTTIAMGSGQISAVTGNVAGLPDPRFVDPAAGDFRLRHDSPLIDNGNGSADGADIQGDRNGDPRVVDGNGNGTTARDIGAYEYQRRAPVAAFSAPAPWTVYLGQSVSFAGRAVDPDGDALTYRWDFGDGTGAATPNASHSFGWPGTKTITLTATDPTQLSGAAAHEVTVAGPVHHYEHAFPAPPVISGVSMLRRRFAVTKRAGAVGAGAAKRGTRVRFRLSAPATPAIGVYRITKGRAGKGRTCAKPSRANRKAKKCRLLTQLPEVKGRRQAAGPGAIDLNGWIRGKALKPGTYEARVFARDAEAQGSNMVRIPFTVVRGR